MQSKSYQYILRCEIEPGFHEEEKFEQLVEFCKEGQIDEVMFVINGEELNQGHLSIQETKPWMELINRGKKMLDSINVRTSINPWPTLLHCDRGRRLKEDQHFMLMVDPKGRQAGASACPLCGEWREYIAEMYAFYATLEPDVLWVEDDFRLHNHAPLEWGGCFCQLHMQEYSRQAGRELTREEFMSAILKPGVPHPFREIWLDTSRRVMVEVAQLIGDVVHRVSPATRVGLMSSVPSVHCAEGRDWSGILHGLAGQTPMVNRPHLPAYTETTLPEYLWYFNMVTRFSRAMVPDSTEIYPELENVPYTRYSKSRRFTQYQIEMSPLVQSQGITLNLFDMMGNGVKLDEGYQKMLSASKDFLTRVTELGLSFEKQTGVKVLFSPESSHTLHTALGKAMEELYTQETYWAGLLSSFGIANTFSSKKQHKGEIVAVSGQYFRNLNEDELIDLFQNNFVLMEGNAAFTLHEMGHGHLAGLESVQRLQKDCGYQVYEQVSNGLQYGGLSEARMSLQSSFGDYTQIIYKDTPQLFTVAKGAEGNTVENGIAVYQNRVLILPYCTGGVRSPKHFHSIRQAILQGILSTLDEIEQPFMVQNEPYVSIYSYKLLNKTALVIVNSSLDSADQLKINLPQGTQPKQVLEYSRTYDGVRDTTVLTDQFILLQSGIASMETKVLLIE